MTTLSILILAAWLLAIARTIVNLALIPRLRPGARPRDLLVSVLIPARDEERTIERTVRAMLAQTHAALEVIVVNDRSTDATGAILERIAREDDRLVIIGGEEPPPGWLGKPWALHQASVRARGSLLLFVDADVVYAPDAVAAAVDHLETSSTGMISLFPRFELRGFWEHVAMPSLAVFLFTFLPLWFANRTRKSRFGIGGGSGNLIRRDLYVSSGGHEALHDAVIDDVALARLARRHGARTEIVRADDLISLRMYHGLREIIDGFTKNVFAAFNRSYAFAALFFLVGVLFYAFPYALALSGDVIGIATVALISVSRAVLFHSLGYRLDNALLGHPPMMLVWLYITARSVWFTGIRRQLHWRGRTYDASGTRFGAD